MCDLEWRYQGQYNEHVMHYHVWGSHPATFEDDAINSFWGIDCEGQTHRHRHRQTDRQTERQTQTQTQRHTQTQRLRIFYLIPFQSKTLKIKTKKKNRKIMVLTQCPEWNLSVWRSEDTFSTAPQQSARTDWNRTGTAWVAQVSVIIVCTQTQTDTHTHTPIHTHMHMHAHTHTLTYTYNDTHTQTHSQACAYPKHAHTKYHK